ncbi:BTAD domain-containing putative transcriptional regulator [Micromonospora sp. NPDC048871]|uniref:AfsR/SARP family transcriptional regulator n=1 Tax=Micromonospora sp. NPDC048871 TaxID=3364259 RepID=UPI003715945B
MRFEVLGPLRVWCDERRLDLGPVQRQVVLAVLLLHADKVVERDRLITGIWGSTPPAYAVNLLQKHISALRRVLDPTPQKRGPSTFLTWTGSGYRLAVAPGGLDLVDFEREVAAARTARDSGDTSAAATALHSALRRWRGPFCAGLTSPALDAERTLLDERRLAALEERIELDLNLGRHLAVVGELRQLVADHPYRERLWCLLMVALYRSGRQAEAIMTFHDVRRHTLDGLGVEPGADLHRLHQQILAADPTLVIHEPGPSVGTAAPLTGLRLPVPAQLPHPVPGFVGRQADLARLDGLLSQGCETATRTSPVAVIAGMAGVGKTALAVHWAHRVRGRFPDGQLYVNLRGYDQFGAVAEPAAVLQTLLHGLGVPPEQVPAGLDARSAMFRTLLSTRRLLILLDNARDAEQVRQLLPGSCGCLVLVTSRNRMTGLMATDAATLIDLDLMTAEESRKLLVGRLGTGRLSAEPTATDQLIQQCAGLPLALSIAAARAANQTRFPLSALVARLDTARDGLDAFSVQERQVDVRAVFSHSYQVLDPATAGMFRLLGLHPGPEVTVPAAASLVGVPRAHADRLIATLVNSSLISEQAPGRHVLHDLLRAYAVELTHRHEGEAARRAAVRRLLDHLVLSAHGADRLLSPSREPITPVPATAGVSPERMTDRQAALRWFTEEQTVLLAALELAAGQGFDTHVWQLAWAMTTYLDRRGRWHDSAAIQTRALAAARRLGDERALALAHRGLGRAAVRLQRPDARSHLTAALTLFTRVGDRQGQARTRLNFAWLCEQQGRHQEALPHVRQAVALFQRCDDRIGLADALNALGWFHAKLGGYRAALTYCAEALALARETGDEDGEAHIRDSLGYIHQLGDQPRQALANYRDAVRLWRELGDRHYEAEALHQLGDLHHAVAEPAAARAAWTAALTIFDEFHHPDAAQVRGKLGKLDKMPARSRC